MERFAHAQTPQTKQAVPPLEKWTVSNPPRYPRDAWYAANHSQNNYRVALHDGRVTVRLLDKRNEKPTGIPFDFTPAAETKDSTANTVINRYGNKKAVKVSDGWIVGADGGEWGGRVDWFSPDGTQQYKISGDQIAAFAQTTGGLFAVQGLAHLSLRIGTLLQFEQSASGKWEARTIVDLKDAPCILYPETSDTFLVVTYENMVRVRVSNQTVTPLINKAFWESLSPNSLAVLPNRDFYIGMRAGVTRVTKTNDTYTVRWLTPPA